MSVSVIVVTHNHRESIVVTLKAARRATRGLTRELIVIDSGSSDGTADAVRQLGEVVVERPNRGFAAAANYGMRLAEGKFLVLMNPDLEVVGGHLSTALALFDADSRLAILGAPARRP